MLDFRRSFLYINRTILCVRLRNPRESMTLRILLLPFIPLVLIGCSHSDEMLKAQRDTIAVLQKDMASLRTQTDSLRSAITRIEQEKQSLVARSASIDSQLNDLKSKIPPLVEQKSVGTKVREIQPVSDPFETYQHALDAFHAKHYDGAEELFQSVIDVGAPDKLEDNCTYWIGECLFAQKKYNDAIEQFRHVFTYKISEKKDDAQIMIANAYLAMGNKKKAKEEYETFVKKFPASPFVKRAKTKISTF